MSLQIKEEDLSPGPEGPLQPPSPFLIVANKFIGGELRNAFGQSFGK